MLQVRDLTKRYRPGDPPALDGVTFAVAPGEAVALLGPSGAGKSTLIRCLNGLLRPDAGQVIWDGRPVHALSGAALRAVRREMGLIFQDFGLIESLSALRNVLVGCYGRYPFWRAALGHHRPEDVAAAQRALERVGLGHLAQAPVRDLSGGQRQRVAIARALVQQPRILLGDEPVSSLDPVTARSVLDLLGALNREEGITLVLSLHDVDLARSVCTRAIGLSAGRVVYDGPVAGLNARTLAQIYGTAA